MNQVNPLHIGALLFTVLVFLFFKLGVLKDDLRTAKVEYQESKQVATKLSVLEQVYNDQKKTNSALQRILKQPSLKSAQIVSTPSKESIKISASSLNANELNSLMGKILNGNYDISKLNISKLDSNKASLEMEIKW
ncbi:hypothetical protein [Sulfurimonas sp.]|uniref:hypothetical protein n=1 Tax=Sulfurimonas sp. TaxID=2022749 RepID=UPI003D110C68